MIIFGTHRHDISTHGPFIHYREIIFVFVVVRKMVFTTSMTAEGPIVFKSNHGIVMNGPYRMTPVTIDHRNTPHHIRYEGCLLIVDTLVDDVDVYLPSAADNVGREITIIKKCAAADDRDIHKLTVLCSDERDVIVSANQNKRVSLRKTGIVKVISDGGCAWHMK